MTYEPKPIRVDGIVLPPDLLELTERLAEHVHDTWAAQRIAAGWTHGTMRDDSGKRHPCLVPYADLPESEKEYDRQSVHGILKAILALGYLIRRRT